MSHGKSTTRSAADIKIGDRFGRLVVETEPFRVATPTALNPNRRDIRVRCRCDCGRERTPSVWNLCNGNTQSCGCVRGEKTGAQLVARNFRHGGTSGGVHLPEYESWNGMMKRCYNKKCKGYPNYGGRGIVVCERWKSSFLDFYEDMGPRTSPRHSLDRIDNEGNYEPANCHWATRREQNDNRRSSVMLEHDGRRMLIKYWANLTGIGKTTLSWRIRKGWSVADALTIPPYQKRKAQ